MALPTTAQIKAHLRITFADDDALIDQLRTAAIDVAGNYIGRPLDDESDPASIGLVVQFLTAHFYSFRVPTNEIPLAVQRLLDPHREILFAP